MSLKGDPFLDRKLNLRGRSTQGRPVRKLEGWTARHRDIVKLESWLIHHPAGTFKGYSRAQVYSFSKSTKACLVVKFISKPTIPEPSLLTWKSWVRRIFHYTGHMMWWLSKLPHSFPGLFTASSLPLKKVPIPQEVNLCITFMGFFRPEINILWSCLSWIICNLFFLRCFFRGEKVARGSCFFVLLALSSR